jgi:glycerophosphoryl diester phosphodiesterase
VSLESDLSPGSPTGMADRRFSDRSLPLVVAHRGASADEPENTLQAFDAAVAAGAHAVEFDVRMSADGNAVVLHDPQVDRTTDGHGLVRDLTLEELKRLRIPAGSDERVEIPTLIETLSLLSGRVAIDVEIKNLPGEPDHEPDEEAAVEATLRALDGSGFVGAVLISSFNPRSIARSRALAPEVPTGLLAVTAMPLEDALSLAAEGGHGWVLPAAPTVLTAGEGIVARAGSAGLRLGTWIVDAPSAAGMLATWGLDAIATNDPRTIVPAVAIARPA